MEPRPAWICLTHLILQLGRFNSVWSQTPRDVTAVIGTSAVLPCTVDFIGTQQVIWKDPRSNIITINEQRIASDVRFSVLRPYVREWNLQIEHVRRSDQGIYVCIINTSPAESYEIALSVWYPPTITDSSPNLIAAKLGEDITLVCNATGFPAPTIKWYKYALTGSKLEVARDRTTFHLNNVTQEQGGTYECEADNRVSPADRRTFKIDIQFPPLIRLPYQKISQSMGKDTLLECMITANPLETHYWEKDGRRLEDDTKYRIHLWDVGGYTKTMGAFMVDLREEDYGEYTCVAENEFGSVRDSLYLYEWRTGDIRIRSTPKDMISHKGQTAHFNCTVEGMSHTDSLVWWKHSPTSGTQRIFTSQPGNHEHVTLDPAKYTVQGQYNLYIHDVNFHDSGTYTCEVNRESNHSAWLTVIGTAHCTSNGTVRQDQTATLTCTLPFTGSDVDWRVDWDHGERMLSSVNEDSAGLVRRFVSFPATIHDAGIYQCIISSRIPPVTEKCTTSLAVTPSDGSIGGGGGSEGGTGGVSDSICKDTTGLVDVPMVIAIFGAGAAGLFILFICILVAVVVSFKRQLTKYKSRHQSSSLLYGTKLKPPDDYLMYIHSPRCSNRYKNGGVKSERDALTAIHYEDQTEV